MPATAITTESVAVGTAPLLQFAAVLQLPLKLLVQAFRLAGGGGTLATVTASGVVSLVQPSPAVPTANWMRSPADSARTEEYEGLLPVEAAVKSGIPFTITAASVFPTSPAKNCTLTR